MKAKRFTEEQIIGILKQAEAGLHKSPRHLESELFDRFLYQLHGEVTQTDIKKGIARAIEVFMAAYGTGREWPS